MPHHNLNNAIIYMVIDHCSYDFFTISYWHLISDICTTILTLDPQLKKASKNRHFLGGKTQKKLAKFFLRLRDAYKKYILQKNWFKTVTGALSSGQHNLHPSIWGRHPQLDDQYRNPNINNRDHLVGQLTSKISSQFVIHCVVTSAVKIST